STSAPSSTMPGTRSARAGIPPASTGRSAIRSSRRRMPSCRASTSCERSWRHDGEKAHLAAGAVRPPRRLEVHPARPGPQPRAEKPNAGVPSSDGHVKLCIGLGFGKILELSGDAFGDQVNVAFKLGEDVAAPGEILMSAEAVEDLRKSTTHQDLAAQLQGPKQVEVGHVQLDYWLLPRP